MVDTDAELLAATVSMAIVIKSKNPRMRRPFRESGSASPGILGTGWDPETQSPVPPGERIRRLLPDGCASISQLCLPSAGVCHTLRAAADPGLPQNHVRGHVILVATPCSSSGRVASSTWSVCPSGEARVRVRY